MTIVRRTNPFGEMLSLRQAMDRLFEDSFVRRDSVADGNHQLPLDIRASGDEVVVEAALPGVKPDDVQISVLGDTLTISASHRDEQSGDDEGYTYREIRRGSFSRTVTLPSNLRTDSATASFDNGLLTLRIPKAEEARPRQIPISSEASTAQVTGPASDEGQA
jgi:HSP20 family protein